MDTKRAEQEGAASSSTAPQPPVNISRIVNRAVSHMAGRQLSEMDDDALRKRKVVVLVREACQLIQKREFELAYDAASLALSYNNNSYKLLRIHCFACILRGDYEGALRDADKMVQKDSETADGFYFAGVAYYGLKRFAEASKAYLVALSLNPHDRVMDQRYWEAQAFIKQKKLAESMRSQVLQRAKSSSVRAQSAAKWLDDRFKPPPPLLRRRKLAPAVPSMKESSELEDLLSGEAEGGEEELFTEEELRMFRQAVDNMTLRMLGLAAAQGAEADDDDEYWN